MGLTKRGGQLGDLVGEDLLTRGRLPEPALRPAAPDSTNNRFQFPTVVSDTFARRAASATVTSPANTDRITRTLSWAGIAGGRDITTP